MRALTRAHTHARQRPHRTRATARSSARPAPGPCGVCAGEVAQAAQKHGQPAAGYLSEGVRARGGGAAGGAQALRDLPLVDKEPTRRLGLRLRDTRRRSVSHTRTRTRGPGSPLSPLRAEAEGEVTVSQTRGQKRSHAAHASSLGAAATPGRLLREQAFRAASLLVGRPGSGRAVLNALPCASRSASRAPAIPRGAPRMRRASALSAWPPKTPPCPKI